MTTTNRSYSDCDEPDLMALRSTGASRAVQRAGTVIFFAIVVAIVVARVGFFQPDLFATFHGSPSLTVETK